MEISFFCALKVTNMSQYNHYRDLVESWEGEKKRQSVEFTITDHTVDIEVGML